MDLALNNLQCLIYHKIQTNPTQPNQTKPNQTTYTYTHTLSFSLSLSLTHTHTHTHKYLSLSSSSSSKEFPEYLLLSVPRQVPLECIECPHRANVCKSLLVGPQWSSKENVTYEFFLTSSVVPSKSCSSFLGGL